MIRYNQYDASEEFGLRAMRGEGRERLWDREDIDAKTTVIGVVCDNEAVGYPISQLHAEGGVISNSVGDRDLVVVNSESGTHLFENPGFEFEMRNETLYGDGVSWNPTTGRSSDGRQLTRIPTRRLYAFAWQDDHGRDSFYGLD